MVRTCLLGDHRNTDDLSEEVHHLLGPCQTGKIAVNDDAVEAVIDERHQVAEQLDE